MGFFDTLLGLAAPALTGFASGGGIGAAAGALGGLGAAATPSTGLAGGATAATGAALGVIGAQQPAQPSLFTTTAIGGGTTPSALTATAASGAIAQFGQSILNARSENGLQLTSILSVMAGRQKNKVVTVVFTMRNTGGVTKMEVLSGRPAIMQSDARRARAFIKKISKGHAKLPRRTVKSSEMKQLQQQLLQRAVSSAACLPAPRC